MSNAASLLDVSPARAIKRVKQQLALASGDIAQGLHVEARTIDRWERGAVYPQQEGRERLAALLDLPEHASAFFATPADAQGWLRDPNNDLGGLTPLEAIRAGRTDRARAALGVMEWGIGI